MNHEYLKDVKGSNLLVLLWVLTPTINILYGGFTALSSYLSTHLYSLDNLRTERSFSFLIMFIFLSIKSIDLVSPHYFDLICLICPCTLFGLM